VFFALWSEFMTETSTIILSALIGSIVSYIGSVLKNFIDVRAKVDESLRAKRTPVYEDLWKKTALLPKWSRREDVTYEHLDQFSSELRDWYFNQGGVFLSKRASKAYGNLQDTIHYVLCKGKKGILLKDNSNDDYEKVRVMCSKLRTELTNDLLSRRGAPSFF
jgi:hypothetical protein